MHRILWTVFALLISAAQSAFAQQPMTMAAMENSVGTFSSGTSLEPITASETSAVVHKDLGNWTFMFHANAFLLDTQQSGPSDSD